MCALALHGLGGSQAAGILLVRGQLVRHVPEPWLAVVRVSSLVDVGEQDNDVEAVAFGLGQALEHRAKCRFQVRGSISGNGSEADAERGRVVCRGGRGGGGLGHGERVGVLDGLVYSVGRVGGEMRALRAVEGRSRISPARRSEVSEEKEILKRRAVLVWLASIAGRTVAGKQGSGRCEGRGGLRFVA